MKVIEICRLTKDYGDNKGIFEISFDIKKGEVFGFLGPNGAGKTTTIRHLMGFMYAKNGSCLIQGMDCGRDAAHIQKNLGYIPGEINLMEDMSGVQFLQFMQKYRGMDNRGRMEELMQRFALDPKGKIKKMSKGMKQKIGIVCAFMHDPEVFIFDEPTSGLDPLMQSTFVELILEEKQKGKTILMSSHMFEEVEKTCDRVGIIKDGHIVSIETMDHLKRAKKKVYRITFLHNCEVEMFLAYPFQSKRYSERCVEVVIQNDIQSLLEALHGAHVVSFDEVTQSLEEIFMQFYGGNTYV